MTITCYRYATDRFCNCPNCRRRQCLDWRAWERVSLLLAKVEDRVDGWRERIEYKLRLPVNTVVFDPPPMCSVKVERFECEGAADSVPQRGTVALGVAKMGACDHVGPTEPIEVELTLCPTVAEMLDHPTEGGA